MYGTQQVLIKKPKEVIAVLEYICSEAKKLTNCGIYYSRQLFFKTGKYPNRAILHKELGTIQKNTHYQALSSEVAQQTLTSVAESFKSYKGLMKLWKKGELAIKPKLPNYLKGRSGLAVATFPGRAVKLGGKNKGKEHELGIRLPLGTKVKAWFGISEIRIPFPSKLDVNSIVEVRILPRNNCFYAEFVYKLTPEKVKLDYQQAMGIDPGLNNWLTCVSTVGTSFIVDGLHLKSLNNWYNKSVTKRKKNQPQGFWSKKLAQIAEKRNRQMRDAVNKAARVVINHCLENKIGNLVFGWNKGQKQESNMGKKNNQKFVQIPTCKLKNRIQQLCEFYGINYIETEESYTSKSSFWDDDFVPTFGEKPEGWKPSGKRVKRGLYRVSTGELINADANGAANVMAKVEAILGFELGGVSIGALSAPSRVHLWTKAKSPRL
ncbi:MAG: transposase [Cyanobacteria bacterium J06633_8]